MELKVERYAFYNDTTIGALYVNGVFESYTLEDKIRTYKVYGKTAIPKGLYDVVITHSPKFGRRLPLLKDVDGYTGIRIHSGNSHEDTGGCLLVGSGVERKAIYESRKAFENLFAKLDEAQENGEKITIEITDYSPDGKTNGKKFLAWTGVSIVTILSALGIRKLIKNKRDHETNN